MSDTDVQSSSTQHALLVIWGQFAQHLGLVEVIERVKICQKRRIHYPQTKVLEFLVALLAGLPHLEDISRDAHPLDQDRAVARAWGQPGWADYSGVSRCLTALTVAEVACIEQALQSISRPILKCEIGLALQQQGCLTYDADLTGRPVANTSTSYPGAAYGYMSDSLHLGYQAALISMHSPTYGRVWLSATQHPGDTTSCTQAEALILAAEAATGVCPLRRTDLLRGRVQSLEAILHQAQSCAQQRQHKYVQAQERLHALCQQVETLQQEVQRWEAHYQALSKAERPHSRLAQAHTRLARCRDQQRRQEQRVTRAERYWQCKQAHVRQWQEQYATLRKRLTQFEQDNATCATPVRIRLRLDAGFGTWENIALLIEMGYDVYTKPYNPRAAANLQRRIESVAAWTQVGGDSEMLAAASIQPATFPYPLDVAVKRTCHAQTVTHSTFLHYGQDRVTDDLPGWLAHYNGRQTIEAGIKEGKNVFQMHHLKVRSLSALALQERFAVFAANFVRWAAYWLVATTRYEAPQPWTNEALSSIKTMVQVGAHTSAEVLWYPTGCLLRFSDQSIYAGHSLQAGNCTFQLPLPLYQNCDPAPF